MPTNWVAVSHQRHVDITNPHDSPSGSRFMPSIPPYSNPGQSQTSPIDITAAAADAEGHAAGG